MNRFSVEPQLRPETYLQSALQSLGRITTTLNRSAVKFDISPSKMKALSPRQKFQLDENSLSSIMEETQKCEKMLSEIMMNNIAPVTSYSKYVTPKPRSFKMQSPESKEQNLVNQVLDKLISSGYLPQSNPNPGYKSLKTSSMFSSGNQYSESHVNSLVERLNLATNQNQQLKKKIEMLQCMLVDKEISQMNQHMRQITESGDTSLIKQLANLRMEKARMNQEFQAQIMKYNDVFRRMRQENEIVNDGSGTGSGMLNEILEENSKLIREKEEDQKTIEELRGKVLSKHRHMRNMSRTMSKLCSNS